MQEISAWLFSSQDFGEGLKLFERYGESDFYKELFRKGGPTPFNKKKLAVLLSELAESEKPKAVEKTKIENRTTVNDSNQQIPKSTNKPEEHKRYLQLLEQRKILYKQLDRNMAALDFTPEGETLRITAVQVLRLYQKITQSYELTDYYEEHGCFPEPAPVKEIKTDEIQRLYVQINKAKKRLEQKDCRNRAKTEKLLAEKMKRLEELKGNE